MMRFRKSNILLGLGLVLGMFLFTYIFLDPSPHGLYGDDEAKKVNYEKEIFL